MIFDMGRKWISAVQSLSKDFKETAPVGLLGMSLVREASDLFDDEIVIVSDDGTIRQGFCLSGGVKEMPQHRLEQIAKLRNILTYNLIKDEQ
jgi:hypothetical protein